MSKYEDSTVVVAINQRTGRVVLFFTADPDTRAELRPEEAEHIAAGLLQAAHCIKTNTRPPAHQHFNKVRD